MSSRFRHTATGAAAMGAAADFTPGRAVQVHEIRLTLSAAATQDTFTVVLDALAGAAYDHQILSQAMAGLRYVTLSFSVPKDLLAGDVLLIDFANNDARTYGLEVIYSESN